MNFRHLLFFLAVVAPLCLCKDEKPPQDNISPPRVQSDRAAKSESAVHEKTTAPSAAESSAHSEPTDSAAPTTTLSNTKSTKIAKSTASATPAVKGFTQPKWATPYDAIAAPIVALNCFLPVNAKTRRCRAPACGLSPIRSPPPPPRNSTCALSIEGRVRIPDAINDEPNFARIHWVTTEFGKKKCVSPTIKWYHEFKDGTGKWVFDACGTEISFQGTPAELVVKGKEKGFLKESGVVATGVKARRVQNCCHNFKQLMVIEDYPFCWYTDYDFHVCWGEEEVKKNLAVVAEEV